MTTWSALLGDEERDEEQAAEPGFFGRLRDSLGKSRRALTGRLGARGRPRRGRLRRDRRRDSPRPRRRRRGHRGPPAYADEPHGGAREDPPRDREPPRRRAERDAPRRRRDHRPERRPPGAAVR